MNSNEMKPVVYLSGKMTGLPDFGRAIFHDAQKRLEAMGYRILNPAWMPLGMDYEQYMRVDFAMLDICDMIVLLPNWTDSKGAKAELAYAQNLNKDIAYYRDGLLEFVTKALKEA